MGNSTIPSLEEFNKTKNLTLKRFQEETPRKMTIHILSDNLDDCRKFIEIFTGENLRDKEALLEKDIKKKINLYSFMNYEIYENTSKLMEKIEKKVNFIYQNPKSETAIYSEVVIILHNKEISKQIDEIKNNFLDNDIMSTNSYYTPFVIIISPEEINLTDFLTLKTFQYKINLDNIFNYFKGLEKEKKLEISESEKEKELETLEFIRKLNVLFCYYNELGDEFSFINSEKKEVNIKIEDDSNITVFINILFLGKSGSGKSTLINLLLGEKKSIEGGTGFSTTSKNIIVYKKAGVPIRFYDVKGIENEKTVDNYAKILTNFNENNSSSKDSINAIFYCMEYKSAGNLIEEMEFKLFEKLIQFNIQIIFLITKTPYDINKKHKNKKTEKARETQRKNIKNSINSLIKSIFKKNNKEEEGQKFINNYLKFFFVNLVRTESLDVPVFGIDKVLSFFSNSVSKEDWEELENACFRREEKKCKEFCKKNPFLRYYSEFEKINERNKFEANEYLKKLKAGAFFSGMIPLFDIGMEYYYKSIFKKKLLSLYGFDYDKAENIVKQNKINDKKKEEKEILLDNKEIQFNESYISQNSGINDEEMIENENKENLNFNEEDFDKRTNNTKNIEKKIDSRIDKEIDNTGKNSTSIFRGAGEIAGIVIKALPTAGQVTIKTGGEIITRSGISLGIKIASWALLPVTCIGFGTWSLVKINKDCHKILNIFVEAFTPLRFDTLFAYIKSFRSAIQYLENIGKKIIKDDEEENKDDEKENKDDEKEN